MKFVFHGGAKEVGKSCIELLTQNYRYILDAGLKFKEHGFEAPFQVFDLPKIDGLFLSHAHLDHSGALPLFEHYNMICPLFVTDQTKEIAKILLRDSYKIARIKHMHPAYEKIDLNKVYSNSRVVDFDKKYNFNNVEFKFINAGHIPGSAMILMKLEGKKILYTGDFRLKSTQLMRGAESDLDANISNGDLKDIDVLICETTYGGKNLPERSSIEEEFLNKVDEVLKKGSVLIPVFALGRAQDILLLLSKKKWPVPIYFDGMCITVTEAILNHNPSYILNREMLKTTFNHVELVKKEKKRAEIVGSKGIFITTSGMMQGGPVLGYVEHMWGNPNNAILMTGFQCKRTNGRLLMEEGYLYLNGWKTYVKCEVHKYDFSGHSDDAQLRDFITRLNPKNLILQHGDPENSMMVKEWAEKNLSAKVFVPAVGDSLEF